MILPGHDPSALVQKIIKYRAAEHHIVPREGRDSGENAVEIWLEDIRGNATRGEAG